MLWIAVDAMGGDFAPRLVVDGAPAATRHFNLGVALVGRAGAIDAELQRHGDLDRSRVRIVDAPDVVTMEESPSTALRRKPGASIRVAADLVARGDAAAVFSAGHTGATVMAAYGAGGIDSTAARAGDPARRRRERRVPAAASRTVRRDGRRVRPRRVRHRVAARRPALDWRGGDERQ